METTTITYQAIRDLAFFQEQYDRLTHEIQQARVQLTSSPPLPADDPRASKREEWRSWLQLQIKSKCRERDSFVQAVSGKGFQIIDLPE
ncbi:MAG: hypothetical protein PHI97_12150 [Desulfobulbus sp.]|nr:hypothetical protein [Desulfobulbus sp.]